MTEDPFAIPKHAPLFEVSYAPPGKLTQLQHHWSNIPPRVKFWWLASGLGISCLALLLYGTAMTGERQIRSNQAREAFLLSTQTPAALAGLTVDTPPLDALQRLYKVIPQYEQWFTDAQNQHINQLLTIEAKRMRDEALKEVQEGDVVITDPAGDIDLQTCQTRILAYQCVLLRYAGDAITRLDGANRAGDVYTAASAYIRLKAALLAMQPPPVATPDVQAPLQGALNLRIAVYDLLRYFPTTAPISDQFTPPIGDITPGKAIQDQHPLP